MTEEEWNDIFEKEKKRKKPIGDYFSEKPKIENYIMIECNEIRENTKGFWIIRRSYDYICRFEATKEEALEKGWILSDYFQEPLYVKEIVKIEKNNK